MYCDCMCQTTIKVQAKKNILHKLHSIYIINIVLFYFSGTFITLDICISRLEDVGTADIRGTVEKIRSQRAYSIQMPDQYVFCHLAFIEYALSRGKLQSADLTGFDERDDDSE